MKKYQTAKELLATKAENKEKKPIYATRKLSIGLVSCMLGLLMAAPIARAEELPPAPGVEAAGQEEAPAKVEEDLLTDEEIQAIRYKANNQENDYYFNGNMVEELKAELRKAKADPSVNYEEAKARLIDEAIQKNTPAQQAPGEVRAADHKAPKINTVSIGDNIITGSGVPRKAVKGKYVYGTVYVSLVDSEGHEKDNGSFTRKGSSSDWKVTLSVAAAKGDKVIAYYTWNNEESPRAEMEVKETLNIIHKDDLKMPTKEIWIEQYVANIINDDEKAEALDLLKKANPTIANDIKSVEFKITGVETKTASYTVTYTDDSKSEEIQAPGLKIKQVTKTSRGTTVSDITIVDNVIKGKLNGEGPFADIKVQIVLRLSKAGKGSFCDENKCTLDKTSENPVDATVNTETGDFSYTLKSTDKLELGNVVGISVKEKNKFKSCSQTTVIAPTPKKTDVKDPKKLTAKEKEAIDAAIREAYKTENGESKLPKGNPDRDGLPAVIQIDDSGNAKIFSPNDVKGNWPPENDYKFFPEKNIDGSYKLKDGAEPVIKIPAKDLVKNIKPDVPTLALSEDKKNITITPNKLDTDAHIITVSYKDKKGKDQTTTATKADDGTWSITSGAGSVGTDGVVTIPTNLMKGGTDVKANVTDNGEYDKSNPLQSDEATLTLEKNKTKAEQITELGGLDPVVMKKWVKDKLDWKDGVKAKDDAKKDEVNNLLAGATFEDFQDDASKEKRNTGTANNTTGFVGKIKVKFDDGSELVVENQTLYVSDHVTWFSKEKTPGGEVVFNKNTPDDAIDVEFKLGKGTKIDNADGKTAIEGKENPVSYQKYKVKPDTDLKTYMHPTLNGTIYNSINNKLKAQDNFIDPKWDTNDFTVTKTNKVFTATATEAFKVTVKPNGGTKAGGGEAKDIVTKVKKNGTYKLPAANTFNPPNENQEFAGWKVGDKEGVKKPNTPIDVKGNITITATWKPKSPGSGSGSGTGTGSGSGTGTGTGTGTGETTTPGTTPEPSQPGNTPGTTPGSENPTGDNPTDPAKNNPDPKDKPEDKKTGEDNKNNPKTPNVEKGDKVINVGDKEVVVPKVVVDKKKGKLDKEERTKIAEKIKQKNPDVVDVKIDENANAYVTFNDGRRERIPAKDLVSKEGFVIPRRDRHSQDESPNRRRAGKNVKTGVESIAGIACTLVASTGALYIGRKKED